MIKEDIATREDVYLLVSAFYSKIRKDPFLGPFFNRVIKDWEEHIVKLTTFWETSLFTTRRLENKYYGNPLAVHVGVDQRSEEHTSELQSRPHLVCRLL